MPKVEIRPNHPSLAPKSWPGRTRLSPCQHFSKNRPGLIEDGAAEFDERYRAVIFVNVVNLLPGPTPLFVYGTYSRWARNRFTKPHQVHGAVSKVAC